MKLWLHELLGFVFGLVFLNFLHLYITWSLNTAKVLFSTSPVTFLWKNIPGFGARHADCWEFFRYRNTFSVFSSKALQIWKKWFLYSVGGLNFGPWTEPDVSSPDLYLGGVILPVLPFFFFARVQLSHKKTFVCLFYQGFNYSFLSWRPCSILSEQMCKSALGRDATHIFNYIPCWFTLLTLSALVFYPKLCLSSLFN